ncbi:MAG: DciA family protein [Pseudomonadota bacterium]
MTTNKPVPIRDVLSGSQLGGMTEKIKNNQELALKLREVLPASVRAHLLSADVHDDQLTVTADHAAWAAKLRYYTSELLNSMAVDHNLTVNRVAVRVRPPLDQDAMHRTT